MFGLGGTESASATVFIVNPQAGNGSTGKAWPWLKSLSQSTLGRFATVFTRGPGDAVQATYKAMQEGSRRIVCVGGDGTLSEVVNGFMAVGPPIRRQSELGFIPNGTGCDFVRTVAIPRNMEQAVHTIARGQCRPIDIGRLWIRRPGPPPVCRHFHNIASFGLGGEVCAQVNRASKAFGPFMSFLWATVAALLRFGKKRVMFRVDDGLEQNATVWNVVVANGRYHGGGMQVAPEARVDDGLFHVSVIGDLSFLEVCRHLPKLYIGRIDDIDKVETWTDRCIEATSAQTVLLEVDGEQPGTLPIVAEIVPKAINLIMSPP